MNIRKARAGDSKACFMLAKQEGGHYWRAGDFKKTTEDKGAVLLVAEENKKIIGYTLGFIVPTKRSEALIHETMVDRKKRGKKTGTKLVNSLCRALFDRGAEIIYAEIKPELLKFYRDSCHFKETDKWTEVSKKKRQKAKQQ